MMRFFAHSAMWVLIAALGWSQPLFAQEKNIGCNGAVVLKTGRSGPCTELARTIAGLLEDPAVVRDHWGIVVRAMDGAPIYSLNEGQLFQPASNAKLFTTAAAMALLGPETTVETTVSVNGIFTGKEYVKGSVYLFGAGDANLSGRAVPYAPKTDEAFPPLRYLEEMAGQIAATGLKTVNGDVVGIGDHFGNQPYPEGWSVDDLAWGYGAPVSALSVNDNQLKVTITPAAEVSSRASIEITPAVPYYAVTNDVMTVDPKSPTGIEIERVQGSKLLRVYGSIGLKAVPVVEHISIDDPPEFAAIALKQLLEQDGVAITGRARAEHVSPDDARGFREISHEPLDLEKMKGIIKGPAIGDYLCPDPCDPAKIPRSVVVASHKSPSLLEDVVLTNKDSLNLNAELLLRRLGDRFAFAGTFAEGARVVRQFLIDAGISGDDFIFYDGSGLSTYDLVTPRATARLLQYAATQPWFADWKASLPVGGVDGSLEARFAKAPLKGKVFAKTGTLGEARALSGYAECASGKTVIFSIMVGNHLPGTNGDREAMDKVVAAIAAAN
jgi:D-alanyl-D-alanine carboxypeptidase/D-alanyl-D-alanine-endopeptidase (penicillin-binding protein 4)